jgi:hypothetical protein
VVQEISPARTSTNRVCSHVRQVRENFADAGRWLAYTLQPIALVLARDDCSCRFRSDGTVPRIASGQLSCAASRIETILSCSKRHKLVQAPDSLFSEETSARLLDQVCPYPNARGILHCFNQFIVSKNLRFRIFRIKTITDMEHSLDCHHGFR